MAEEIEFGMVGFIAGVIQRRSTFGSEGIAEYTTTQYIGIADP